MFISNRDNLFDTYKYHTLLFLKLLILLIFIGLFERCVFALFHSHLSNDYSITEVTYTLLWGIKFDSALAGFFGTLYILIAYLLKRVFSISEFSSFKFLLYIFASIIFLLQGGDIIYFSDASRHLGYEITDTFNDAPELMATAWSLYKLPLLFHLFMYPVLLFIIHKVSFATEPLAFKLTGFKTLHLEVIYISLLIISLVIARGGVQSIPIEPIHAQEISDSTKASLALNGAYNAIFNLFNNDVIKPIPIKIPESFDINTALKSLYVDDTNFSKISEKNNNEWKPNIIFIFLESWPAMYMQSYGYDKNVTPFFDDLRKKSLTSNEMLAGGHRTTEGMYSSLCSAQNPLGKTIAQSQLQDYEYRCLPRNLRELGYHTVFFQGSNKNTSGTGAFAQLLGFRESYGKADIIKRKYEENHWGVYDQDLYEHVYQSIKKTNGPFFIGINSNTTHDISLPKGTRPKFKKDKTQPSNLNALNFADTALKEFFDKVENDKDINDTLWVIFSDHTAGLKSSRLNNYRIPFLIYHKDKVQPQHVAHAASQRDITPTVLDILNLNKPKHFTGKTLFNSANPPYFADYYHSGILGWIERDLLIEISVSNPDNVSCYNYISDKLLKNKISCPDNIEKIRNRALAFTVRSQQALFNGNGLKNLLQSP